MAPGPPSSPEPSEVACSTCPTPTSTCSAGQTHERTHPDVTIRTCWDADRLDLGRVGITPHPEYLRTEVARRAETIAWADSRASLGFVPELVLADWGIDLSDHSSIPP
jgi:uncharacterized protein